MALWGILAGCSEMSEAQEPESATIPAVFAEKVTKKTKRLRSESNRPWRICNPLRSQQIPRKLRLLRPTYKAARSFPFLLAVIVAQAGPSPGDPDQRPCNGQSNRTKARNQVENRLTTAKRKSNSGHCRSTPRCDKRAGSLARTQGAAGREVKLTNARCRPRRRDALDGKTGFSEFANSTDSGPCESPPIGDDPQDSGAANSYA